MRHHPECLGTGSGIDGGIGEMMAGVQLREKLTRRLRGVVAVPVVTTLKRLGDRRRMRL
jgi:hypothetical protein